MYRQYCLLPAPTHLSKNTVATGAVPILYTNVKEPTHSSKRVEHVVPELWAGLVLRVDVSHRVNLIAPFPLGQSCPRGLL